MVRVAVCFSTCLLFCATVAADRGQSYLLLKAGSMDVDVHKAQPVPFLGVLLGYGVAMNLALEAELDYGIGGGEYEVAGRQASLDIWTLGGYAASRLPLSRHFYFKGRLGALWERYEAETRESRGGFSGSMGFGMSYGQIFGGTISLEAEYTAMQYELYQASLAVTFTR